MITKISQGLKLFSVILALFVISCASSVDRPLMDSPILGREVQVKERAAGPLKPAARPEVIYVADFRLDSRQIKRDEGLLPDEGFLKKEILQREGPLLPRSSPEFSAPELVNQLSAYLVRALNEYSLPARRLGRGQPPPQRGWLLRGEFTQVDEGNRAQRAAIGFGAGATHLEVQVQVVDLGADAARPFLVFGTGTGSGQMPGAAVSMNPYAAAAKFVLEKNASQNDVRRTASEIAWEIVQFMKAQGLYP